MNDGGQRKAAQQRGASHEGRKQMSTQRYLNWKDHRSGSKARASREVGGEYHIDRRSPYSNSIGPTMTVLDRAVVEHVCRDYAGNRTHRHLGMWPTLEAAKVDAE